MNGVPLIRAAGDRYVVDLGEGGRALLAELCRQSRELLTSEDPSSDPAVARLFPPAYQDDPLRNLEYEADLGESPRNEKLAALDTMERTLSEEELSEDDLLAWIAVVNDLRLVLGTRLEITEESAQEGFADEDPRAESHTVFVALGELLGEMLAAVDPDLDDPPAESLERD